MWSTRTRSKPPANSVGLVGCHCEVDLGRIFSGDLVVQGDEAALELEVVAVEPPKHDRRGQHQDE